MKLLMSCPKCSKDVGTGDREMQVEFRDEGLYIVTCSKNHESIVAIQNQKYEILFEMAAFAMLDGYYREAVSGFAVTIERLHEFYLSVLSEANNIPREEFLSVWKHVQKQSERQFGGFLFAYLLINKKSIYNIGDVKLKTKKETFSKFRNRVIHEGYIPSFQEALEFGSIVLNYAQELIKQLKNSHGQYFPKSFFYHLKEKGSIASCTTMIGTILNSAYAVEIMNARDLEMELNKLKGRIDIGAHCITRN